MLEYVINPVRMGGLVKETDGETVKIHLHGRLGVITVPGRLVPDPIALEPGHELRFYFSYLQINEHPYDYDAWPLLTAQEVAPVLVGAEPFCICFELLLAGREHVHRAPACGAGRRSVCMGLALRRRRLR